MARETTAFIDGDTEITYFEAVADEGLCPGCTNDLANPEDEDSLCDECRDMVVQQISDITISDAFRRVHRAFFSWPIS